MGKFDGVMIFCDFDNTLTTSDKSVAKTCREWRINPKNFEAVKRFTEEGGKFVMATGRNPDEVSPLLECMPIYDIAVCTNGTLYSFSQGKAVVDVVLADEAIDDLKDICSLSWMRNWRTTDADFVNQGWDVGDEEDALKVLLQQKMPLHKIAFWGREDREYCEKIHRYLTENYGKKYTVEASFYNFFELYVKGGGKAEGVKRLAKECGAKKIICVGDMDNDIEMIKLADVGVCVANGSDRVKAVADVICASSEFGAIADVVRMLDSGEI